MFLKSIRLNSLSLTLKLVILYTLSTVGILTALGLLFYSKMVRLGSHFTPEQLLYLRAECYDLFIVLLLVAALAALGFGYWVARKGLSRISEFETMVRQITVTSLHQRIDLEEWPDELKQLGHEFNVMLDRLKTSFDQLHQFSSDIAHELRTPVQNLMGVTEVALSKKRSAVAYQRTLTIQMEEFRHLSKLIEDLLFLARSEQAQLPLMLEDLDAREEVQQILELYQPLADEKQIALSCKGQSMLFADRSLFKRIMNNLLSNALRYTAEKGQISIELQSLDSGTCIFIKDTGKGISAEHLPKIFDRCYRVEEDRNSESGGLGLGLAIVKSIMDLHQGTITISSQVNQGTCVMLLFKHDNFVI